ncbi:MAG TPA: hypothetical protein PKY26_07570 [Acetivibrio clariflavus]|nr:hypothetical protein [Acetivibrio clariflavus]
MNYRRIYRPRGYPYIRPEPSMFQADTNNTNQIEAEVEKKRNRKNPYAK